MKTEDLGNKTSLNKIRYFGLESGWKVKIGPLKRRKPIIINSSKKGGDSFSKQLFLRLTRAQRRSVSLLLLRVLRFFCSFALFLPRGSRGPPQRVNDGTECSATSCRGMINSLSGEERVPFILHSCQKRGFHRCPSSTQHLSLGDKDASKRSLQPASSGESSGRRGARHGLIPFGK